jgi:MoaA/NifB/PqqE/SkfB family radical SAM enzyme
MAENIDPSEVDNSLMGLEFPASKEEIVQHARELDISADTMNFFELIPAGYYDTPDELREMIEDPASDEEAA